MFRYLLLIFSALLLWSCSVLKPERVGKFALYEVKRGDSLSTISARLNVPLEELEYHNDFSDPDRIYAGQTILIPVPEAPAIGGALVPRARQSDFGKVDRAVIRSWIGQLGKPLRKYRYSSEFGKRHSSFHEGADFAVRSGTPFYAAHEGKVVYSGNGLSGYGNLIVLKSEGLLTVYAHNKRNLVKRGQTVRAGQRIGLVGSTGRATGPHLHFETRVRDRSGKFRAVDPEIFYPRGF